VRPIALALGLCLSARGADLRTVGTRWVVAEPGVTLRASPAGEAIALVPYGEMLTAAVTDDALPDTYEGHRGHWVQISYGLERGWVFDAWLLPMPAPPEPCASIPAWAAEWTPAGAAFVEVRSTRPGDSRRSQSYEGGMSLMVELGGGELWLPGLTLPQAWAGARRCAPGLAGRTRPGWPPSLEGEGLTLRVEARRLRVAPATGGAPLLTLEVLEGGVRVGWRG